MRVCTLLLVFVSLNQWLARPLLMVHSTIGTATTSTSSSSSGEPSSSRPNIIMVLLDDVGWKDVGFHDDSFHTPNIDELVSEGIELTAFYTSPLCTPSRAHLMTGIYNFKTGMQDFLILKTEPRGLPLNHKLLPEKLLDAGYQTRMVGKWHLGFHMDAYTPMSRGFERFYGIYRGEGDHFLHLSTSELPPARGTSGCSLESRNITGPNIVEDGKISDDNSRTSMHSTTLYTEKALTYLEEMADNEEPWFLYLAYQAIHAPVQVEDVWYTSNSCESIPSNSRSEELPVADGGVNWMGRKKICGMMAQVDHGLGMIRSLLEKTGEWNNTVMFLFSDNGGNTDLGSINYPFRGKKEDYWEGAVRVPAVIAGGFTTKSLSAEYGSLGSSYKYHHMTHITDMHATALSLAGIKEGLSTPPFVSRSSASKGEANTGAGGDRSSLRSHPALTESVPSEPVLGSTSRITAGDGLDGMDLWDAVTASGDAVRDTVVIGVNSASFGSSGCVRHGRYKLMRNPEPQPHAVYYGVLAALADYGFFVPQDIFSGITREVLQNLGFHEGGDMYLINIEENPREVTTCPKGMTGHVSCSNLYYNDSYASVREELSTIFSKAMEDLVPSTLKWEDDGPLTDPFYFGGWLPWRDDEGFPRALYGGEYIADA